MRLSPYPAYQETRNHGSNVLRRPDKRSASGVCLPWRIEQLLWGASFQGIAALLRDQFSRRLPPQSDQDRGRENRALRDT